MDKICKTYKEYCARHKAGEKDLVVIINAETNLKAIGLHPVDVRNYFDDVKPRYLSGRDIRVDERPAWTQFYS